MPTVQQIIPQTDTDLRDEAVKRLNKKREFNAHLVSYILINVVVWAIWGVIFAASGVWFPWPAFVTLGWGIGLAFHAWDVYGRKPITEDEILKEEARLRH
jgi:flagellar biosynthesis component FlhA